MNNAHSHIFLGLGSNLGSKEKNIEEAYKKIEEQIGRIISKSAFYVTRPQGFNSDNLFVNSVCEVISNIDIITIFASTQSIEKEMGRVKKSKNNEYSDRIIDIDILLVDNLQINTPKLTIPHPHLHLRKFVLEPLVEISPNVIHPILKKNIKQIFEELSLEEYP